MDYELESSHPIRQNYSRKRPRGSTGCLFHRYIPILDFEEVSQVIVQKPAQTEISYLGFGCEFYYNISGRFSSFSDFLV